MCLCMVFDSNVSKKVATRASTICHDAKQDGSIKDKKSTISATGDSLKSEEMSPYFCLLEKQYLCENCHLKHKAEHPQSVDSVKNILTWIFNEWRLMHEHA